MKKLHDAVKATKRNENNGVARYTFPSNEVSSKATKALGLRKVKSGFSFTCSNLYNTLTRISKVLKVSL